MSETTSLVGYLAVAGLVALTPGPNLAIVIRTVAESDLAAGLRATLGVGVGLGIWAATAALGIAAVLRASPVAFAVLQAAGGAWLIYIGIRAWLAVGRVGDGQPVAAGGRQRDFQAGLVTVLLNPLAGAFYLAALPGFVRPGSGAIATTLLLAAIHIAMVVVWLASCAALVARGGRVLGTTARRLLSRATGVVLVVFGVRSIVAAIGAAILLAACSGSPEQNPSGEPNRCDGDGYSVDVPDGWFVHPGSAEVDVGPCELFAAEPFELRRHEEGRWNGVQISIWTFVGCLGSFETVVEEEAVELGGVQAFRRTMEAAEGGGPRGLRAYEYVVMAGPIDCEERRWFIARTENDDPGSFEENSAVLDRMMESVTFDD